MGGAIVPAVTAVSLRVVRITSMVVAVVLLTGQYLVGVVIVVYRLFSTRKL